MSPRPRRGARRRASSTSGAPRRAGGRTRRRRAGRAGRVADAEGDLARVRPGAGSATTPSRTRAPGSRSCSSPASPSAANAPGPHGRRPARRPGARSRTARTPARRAGRGASRGRRPGGRRAPGRPRGPGARGSRSPRRRPPARRRRRRGLRGGGRRPSRTGARRRPGRRRQRRRAAAAQEQAVVRQRDLAELVQRLAERRSALDRVGAREQGVGWQAARPVANELDLDAGTGRDDRHDRGHAATLGVRRERRQDTRTRSGPTIQRVPRSAVVVKLGSSTLVDEHGRVRRARLDDLAGDIAALWRDGVRVCVVSSGAIALGLGHLERAERPTRVSELQAAAAVGQALLQQAWNDALASAGASGAQVLLTEADVRAPRVLRQRPPDAADAARVGRHAGRQRERLDLQRRDHLRRQRRPRRPGRRAAEGAAARCC